MNRIRKVGLVLCALTVTWVGLDVSARRTPSKEGDAHRPPGLQRTVPQLGDVETSFAGPLELTIHQSSQGPSEISSPLASIRGRDPEFSETSMVLLDAELTRYRPQHGDAPWFSSTSQSATLILLPGTSTPEPDPKEPWVLQHPQLQVSFGGGQLTLETSVLSAHISTNQLFTKAPFHLFGLGIDLQGTGLLYDSESAKFTFGKPGEELTWSVLGPSPWNGTTDGTGTLTLETENAAQLLLESETQASAHSPDLGSMTCDSMTWELAALPEGWVLSSGLLSGPCDWKGSLGQESTWELTCPEATMEMHEGESTLDLAGPVKGAVSTEGDWVAEGGAWLKPYQGHLRGPVSGTWDGRTLSAGFFAHSDGLWSASGQVLIEEDGRVLSGSVMQSSPDGSWTLEGPVSFSENNRSLSADQLSIAPDGSLRASGNVLAILPHERGPIECRTKELRRMPLTRSTEHVEWRASGGVEFSQENMRAMGGSLRLVEGTRMEISGAPATALVAIQNQEVSLQADRFIWEDDRFHPTGSPVLRTAASLLGLAGEDLQISAQRMGFDFETQEWSLLGNISLRGGATGYAEKILGDPQWIEFFPGSRSNCMLAGTLEGGREIELHADSIRLEQNKTIHLQGSASTTIAQEGDRPLELTGRQGLLSASGGWFKNHVELKSEDLRGASQHVLWEFSPEGQLLLRMEGPGSQLRDTQFSAKAQKIIFDDQHQTLDLTGTATQTSLLEVDGGKRISGDTIQFDFANHLLSGTNMEVRIP